MAEPRPDDEDTGVDAEAGDASRDEAAEAPAPEASTDTTPAPKARKVKDPKADVAARRAATKARMEADAGDGKGARSEAESPSRSGPAAAGGKARRAAASKPMAKASADDPTGARARRQQASATKRVPRPSKRTGGAAEAKGGRPAPARSGNPKKAAEVSDTGRYTAPIPRSQMESPRWVPVLMFTLLGGGALLIIVTYTFLGGRQLTMGLGLALILGGIMTATQLN